MRTLTALTVLTSIWAAAALGAAPVAAQSRATNAVSSPAAATAMARTLVQVRDAERRRADAVANRDVDAMRRLIGGEYYHVESNGRVRAKTEFLQMLLRNEFEFQSYETDDVDITLLGTGRDAVVTGRFVAQAQSPHRPREFRGRFVRLWTLEGDTWRNALHQSTEIKTVAPAPR